jgi:hypothetical protein
MSPDFILCEVMMKILITAAVFSVLALSPASAKMMACTTANMGTSAMAMMPEAQSPANKEMAMANTDVSNGKMRSACKHYMKAQKLSMAK